MPDVIQNLGSLGDDFLLFLKTVSEGKFPKDNIALRLLLDVGSWYSCTHTTKMKYSDESKLFWKIGYKLFHGSFIRFMSGAKNEGATLFDKNPLDPASSSTNFALPRCNIV